MRSGEPEEYALSTAVPNGRRRGFVPNSLAMSLLALAFALSAQDAQPHKALIDWVRETRAARLRGDPRAWLEAGQHSLALAPDHPDLLIGVARAHAALGQAKQSLDLLRQAIDRGAGIDIPRVQEFQKLPPAPELDILVARARKNLQPVARAQLFAVIPDATAASEGIAYDPVSKHLFVGTNHGEILEVDEAGSFRTLVPRGSGLLEVLGLKVDAQRRLIWAVSATFPDMLSAQPKAGSGVSGVYAYRLDGGKKAYGYSLDERPVLHGFNDLALARNGDVYVTDTAQAVVKSVSTLNARCPAEYNQTTAVVAGDQLYVVGGSPALDSAAAPLAKEPRPQILRIPLAQPIGIDLKK